MLAGLASLVFIPLLTICMAHMMWAFGSTFPMQSEKDLARLVIGAPDIEKMPPRILSFLVGIAAIAAGIWALALSDPTPNLGLILGGIAATIIFTLRGIAPFTKQWQSALPEEPFRSSDRKLYGPLCLFIGAGFALLTLLNATPLAD